jgi:hypothetical protein
VGQKIKKKSSKLKEKKNYKIFLLLNDKGNFIKYIAIKHIFIGAKMQGDKK